MFKSSFYGYRFYSHIVNLNTYSVHTDNRNSRIILCTCSKCIRVGSIVISTGKKIKRITRSKYNIRY